MTPRIDFQKTNPKPLQLMLAIESYLRTCGLDHGLLHLIKLRASQINGCAYCIDMHSKDARAGGESEQRLYALTEGHVPDAAYNAVREHFSADELVNLSLAITTINAWNRLSIAFRAVPGTYQPPNLK
jgi:AhpD family alkylhydroperoxidase